MAAISTTTTGSKVPTRRIDAWTYFWVLIVGFVATAILALLVLLGGSPVDTGGAAAAAGVIALVTAVAVGIERVLEGFWTLVDAMAKNPSAPFYNVATLLETIAASLTTDVKAPLEDLNTFLGSGDSVAKELIARKPAVQGQVAALLTAVNAILAGSDPKSWPSLTILKAGLGDLQGTLADTGFSADLALAASTLDIASTWVDSLISNPGRKLMSLFAGTVLGLAVTGLLGLDLVHAALGVKAPSGWAWGMALTGIVVGLGSNPTHELIKAIQDYKQSTR